MKKKLVTLLAIVTIYLVAPYSVIALNYDEYVCAHISTQSDCDKVHTCRWTIDDNVNSGYCVMKEFDHEVCQYEYTVYSSHVNKNVKCQFWITYGDRGHRKSYSDLIIDWRSAYDNKVGNLSAFNGTGKGFLCSGEDFYFYNWDTTVGLRQENEDGVVIYDFRKKWVDSYLDTHKCPKLKFVRYNGIEYVAFEEDEPILNNGGIIEDDEQSNSSEQNTNNNNNDNSNSDAEEIKNQYIGNMTCGGLTNFKFNKRLPKLTSAFYNLLKVAVPVLLVIKGMMDWFKSMSAGKEDEMKKNQKKFINRLIAGLCAFIVFVLVETIIGWITPKTGDGNAMSCVNCFINNSGCIEIVLEI